MGIDDPGRAMQDGFSTYHGLGLGLPGAKRLMDSFPPIVDCGVHYVDVMCQMTRSKPVRVSGIGARLTGELPEGCSTVVAA